MPFNIQPLTVADADLQLRGVGGTAFVDWTMNVEFCKVSSGSAQKFAISEK